MNYETDFDINERRSYEIEFIITFTGINGEQAALVTRLSASGLAAPLDIDYARSWSDFVQLLELEAHRAFLDNEDIVTGAA